jgi:hypothetical protein
MSRFVSILYKQGAAIELSWEEFERINSTGLTPEMFTKVRTELLAKGIYNGGGGKDATYILTAIRTELETARI